MNYCSTLSRGLQSHAVGDGLSVQLSSKEVNKLSSNPGIRINMTHRDETMRCPSTWEFNLCGMYVSPTSLAKAKSISATLSFWSLSRWNQFSSFSYNDRGLNCHLTIWVRKWRIKCSRLSLRSTNWMSFMEMSERPIYWSPRTSLFGYWILNMLRLSLEAEGRSLQMRLQRWGCF